MSDGVLCCSGAAGGSMDTLARLIVGLALALLCGSGWAFGEVNKKSQGVFTASAWCKASSAPAAASCEWNRTHSGGTMRRTGSPSCRQTSATQYYCDVSYEQYYEPTNTWGWPGSDTLGVTYAVDSICPDHSTELPNGMCACNLESKPSGGNCEKYTCGPSGSYSPMVTPDQKVSGVGDMCIGGCGVKPGSFKAGADGQIWAVWPFKSTGSFCGGEAGPSGATTGESPRSDAPIPCGVDKCPGTVNGANVCVACKNQSTEGPSTSASGAQTGDPNVKGSDTKTECTESECTTTTTNRDGDGNVIGTSTKTEGKENFCTQNPQSPLCKKSSWGGSCGAYSCDGDAVQCALSLEVHKRNCEWADYDEATKQRGFAAMNGELQPQGHPATEAETKTVSFAASIDQTDRLGGGCPQDDHLSIGSASVVIPWSRACGSLQLAGQLAVAACLLAAAFIMFKT